jgi:phospholipid transport system substrate-binding protein
VRNRNGDYKIIDVVVEGISMGAVQRDKFSSVIQRGGGNIDALLSELRRRAGEQNVP